MLMLAIWLFLAGYTIAMTGRRNLGLSYKPQSSGDIKLVDSKGNEAKTYSLMDVITCGEASGISASSQGETGAKLPGPLSVAHAQPMPEAMPGLRVIARARPALQPNPPGIRLPGIGRPNPSGVPIPGLMGTVQVGLQALVKDVENALSKVGL